VVIGKTEEALTGKGNHGEPSHSSCIWLQSWYHDKKREPTNKVVPKKISKKNEEGKRGLG